MSTPGSAMQQLMMDKAVDMSLSMTAKMLGIPKETVTKIVQVGMPMMAKMADENPELLKSMYAQSVQTLPEPMQQFYAKLGESPEAQKMLLDQYKTMAGPMMDSINRQAAKAAGVTEEQAGQAIASTNPAVLQAVGEGAATKDEKGFGDRLKSLAS